MGQFGYKDYEDRRRRQAQGIERAKGEGRYRGRPEDAKRNAAIIEMLRKGMSWNAIIEASSSNGGPSCPGPHSRSSLGGQRWRRED
jgi:DNA invertase Pin-like site-specific DNA recombinase